MTEQELIALKIIVSLQQELKELPIEHPSEQDDFTNLINQLQNIILARSARRELARLVQ